MKHVKDPPIRLSKPTENDDTTDTIILSIALASGRFKTELRLPLFGPEKPDEALRQWMEFVQTGFKIGATSMDATLKRPEPAK